MTPDVVTLLERIYDVDRSPAVWLSDVTSTAAPLLDQGLGVFAYFVDLSSPERVAASGLVNFGLREGLEPPGFDLWAAAVPIEFQRAIHLSMPCGFATKLPKEPYDLALSTWRELPPQADAYGVNGIDTRERGAVLVSFVSDAARRGVRLDDAVWARVAAHLATGCRLVHALAAVTTRDEPEAVLSPAGCVAHATGAAKEPEAQAALRSMVQRIDRARTRGVRTAPEEASLLWEAMVEGRWSLVDHFDSDGRRYVVARVNEPKTDPLAALTDRERQVVGLAASGRSNKLIAYELGVGESNVSTLLSRAQKKLGATDRVSLMRAYLAFRWRTATAE